VTQPRLADWTDQRVRWASSQLFFDLNGEHGPGGIQQEAAFRHLQYMYKPIHRVEPQQDTSSAGTSGTASGSSGLSTGDTTWHASK
jgi:hypothetical protein